MSGSGRSRRVLVTGAAGMLASEVLRRTPADWTTVSTDLGTGRELQLGGVDLADAAQVQRLWRDGGPFDAVLHCAAYTAVDAAEAEPERARRVNVEATANLARACASTSTCLVVLSTDFVFDGCGPAPYRETDAPAPLSVYGRTKLEGEQAALALAPQLTTIVRTQWLYGPGGRHFPRTIVSAARERGALKVVSDQIGSPTSTLELAPALWDLLRTRASGLFHAACEGQCSWFEFARAVLAGVGLGNVPVEPCDTAQFPRPARRPAYSVLDSSKLARLRGRKLATWQTALDDYLKVEAL